MKKSRLTSMEQKLITDFPFFEEVYCFSTIDSTSAFLKGVKSRWVMAMTLEQTAGYGKNKSGFVSPKYAGLYMSVSIPLNYLEQIRGNYLMTSLTDKIVSQLNQQYQADLCLKWPNDIVTSGGQKVGGILCEIDKTTGRVIFGVGINIIDTPAIKGKFQSLRRAGISISRYELAKVVIGAILDINAGEKMSTYCYYGRGKKCRVIQNGTIYKGVFGGIDDGGKVIIQTQDYVWKLDSKFCRIIYE